jgi:ATP-dependent Zn protease
VGASSARSAGWPLRRRSSAWFTTGAESDLELSTKIARSMVGRGMSERIGPISVLPQDGDPRMSGVSDEMLDTVDDEVRRIRRMLRRGPPAAAREPQ